jgi:hypothetical protein
MGEHTDNKYRILNTTGLKDMTALLQYRYLSKTQPTAGEEG